VGRCDAKEGGRCKFAREGALHFESAGEAQEYAAELLAHRSGGFTQGGAGSATDVVGSGSLGDSDVVLIADHQEEMSLDELFAHMARLKDDPGVWEQVLSSPRSKSGELASVADGALAAGGRENLQVAIRAVRHTNMGRFSRRTVMAHPDLWDEALSDPGFYGWSDDDVRDVQEVSRETGLSDEDARQRVLDRFRERDMRELYPSPNRERRVMNNEPMGGDYRMRGFVRPEPESFRKVARRSPGSLPDEALIRDVSERLLGGSVGE
jgi:hypothetical protein